MFRSRLVETVKSVSYPDEIHTFLGTPTENSPIIGNTLSHRRLSWLARGSNLIFVENVNSSILAYIDLSDFLQDSCSITCGVELPYPNEQDPLLLLGCTTALGGMLLVYHPSRRRAYRVIDLDIEITCLSIIDCSKEKSRILPSLLKCMNGVIAAGGIDGSIIFIDMCKHLIDKAIKGQFIAGEANWVWPKSTSRVTYVNYNDSEHAISCKIHLCRKKNESLCFVLNDVDGEVQAPLQNGTCSPVTCLHYNCSTATLFAGFEVGVWHMYSIVTLSPLFVSSSEVGSGVSVVSMSCLEPSDDPRATVYLWVGHSSPPRRPTPALSPIQSPSQSPVPRQRPTMGDDPPFSIMYALMFQEKTVIPSYGVYYSDFLQCSIVHELEMTKEFPNFVLGKLISVNSITASFSHKYLCKERGEGSEELRLWSIVWECGESTSNTYVTIFDLNQWYKEQMPSEPRRYLSESATRMPIKDTPYFSTVLLPNLCDQIYVSISVDPSSVTAFRSLFPIDAHYYPSAVSFRCMCIGSEGVTYQSVSSVQEWAKKALNRNCPLFMSQPCQSVQDLLSVALLPVFDDLNTTFTNTLSTDACRVFLVTVCVENGLSDAIIDCAKHWYDTMGSDDSCSLSFIVNALWDILALYKNKFDKLCIPLFDHSGIEPDFKSRSTIKFCFQIMKQVFDIYLKLQKDFAIGNNICDVEYKLEAIQLIILHANLVQWCLNMRLLPEKNSMGLPEMSIPYHYDLLKTDTDHRRKSGTLMIDAVVRNLMPDAVVEWGRLYPPPSIQSLLRIVLAPAVEVRVKHLVFHYFLLDIIHIIPHEKYSDLIEELLKYHYYFNLSEGASRIIQAYWDIDRQNFQDAVDGLLDLSVKKTELADWEHRLIIDILYKNKQYSVAFKYLKGKNPVLKLTSDLKVEISLTVAVGNVANALFLTRQQPNTRGELQNHFFSDCLKFNQMKALYHLPLDNEEEKSFLTFLRSSKVLHSQDCILYFYISRRRFTEAFALYDKMKQSGLCGNDSKSRNRDLIIKGLKESIGPTAVFDRYIWDAQHSKPPADMIDHWKPTSAYLKCDNSNVTKPSIHSAKEFTAIAFWQAKHLNEKFKVAKTLKSGEVDILSTTVVPEVETASMRAAAKRKHEDPLFEMQTPSKRPREALEVIPENKIAVTSSPAPKLNYSILQELVSTPKVIQKKTPSTISPPSRPTSILKSRSARKEELSEELSDSTPKKITFSLPMNTLPEMSSSKKKLFITEPAKKEEKSDKPVPRTVPVRESVVDYSSSEYDQESSPMLETSSEFEETPPREHEFINLPDTSSEFEETPPRDSEFINLPETSSEFDETPPRDHESSNLPDTYDEFEETRPRDLESSHLPETSSVFDETPPRGKEVDADVTMYSPLSSDSSQTVEDDSSKVRPSAGLAFENNELRKEKIKIDNKMDQSILVVEDTVVDDQKESLTDSTFENTCDEKEFLPEKQAKAEVKITNITISDEEVSSTELEASSVTNQEAEELVEQKEMLKDKGRTESPDDHVTSNIVEELPSAKVQLEEATSSVKSVHEPEKSDDISLDEVVMISSTHETLNEGSEYAKSDDGLYDNMDALSSEGEEYDDDDDFDRYPSDTDNKSRVQQNTYQIPKSSTAIREASPDDSDDDVVCLDSDSQDGNSSIASPEYSDEDSPNQADSFSESLSDDSSQADLGSFEPDSPTSSSLEEDLDTNRESEKKNHGSKVSTRPTDDMPRQESTAKGILQNRRQTLDTPSERKNAHVQNVYEQEEEIISSGDDVEECSNSSINVESDYEEDNQQQTKDFQRDTGSRKQNVTIVEVMGDFDTSADEMTGVTEEPLDDEPSVNISIAPENVEIVEIEPDSDMDSFNVTGNIAEMGVDDFVCQVIGDGVTSEADDEKHDEVHEKTHKNESFMSVSEVSTEYKDLESGSGSFVEDVEEQSKSFVEDVQADGSTAPETFSSPEKSATSEECSISKKSVESVTPKKLVSPEKLVNLGKHSTSKVAAFSDEKVTSGILATPVKLVIPDESFTSTTIASTEESVTSDKSLTSTKFVSPEKTATPDVSLTSTKCESPEKSATSDEPLTSGQVASPEKSVIPDESFTTSSSFASPEKSVTSDKSMTSTKFVSPEKSATPDESLISSKFGSPEKSAISNKSLIFEKSVSSGKSTIASESLTPEMLASPEKLSTPKEPLTSGKRASPGKPATPAKLTTWVEQLTPEKPVSLIPTLLDNQESMDLSFQKSLSTEKQPQNVQEVGEVEEMEAESVVVASPTVSQEEFSMPVCEEADITADSIDVNVSQVSSCISEKTTTETDIGSPCEVIEVVVSSSYQTEVDPLTHSRKDTLTYEEVSSLDEMNPTVIYKEKSSVSKSHHSAYVLPKIVEEDTDSNSDPLDTALIIDEDSNSQHSSNYEKLSAKRSVDSSDNVTSDTDVMEIAFVDTSADGKDDNLSDSKSSLLETAFLDQSHDDTLQPTQGDSNVNEKSVSYRNDLVNRLLCSASTSSSNQYVLDITVGVVSEASQAVKSNRKQKIVMVDKCVMTDKSYLLRKLKKLLKKETAISKGKEEVEVEKPLTPKKLEEEIVVKYETPKKVVPSQRVTPSPQEGHVILTRSATKKRQSLERNLDEVPIPRKTNLVDKSVLTEEGGLDKTVIFHSRKPRARSLQPESESNTSKLASRHLKSRFKSHEDLSKAVESEEGKVYDLRNVPSTSHADGKLTKEGNDEATSQQRVLKKAFRRSKVAHVEDDKNSQVVDEPSSTLTGLGQEGVPHRSAFTRVQRRKSVSSTDLTGIQQLDKKTAPSSLPSLSPKSVKDPGPESSLNVRKEVRKSRMHRFTNLEGIKEVPEMETSNTETPRSKTHKSSASSSKPAVSRTFRIARRRGASALREARGMESEESRGPPDLEEPVPLPKKRSRRRTTSSSSEPPSLEPEGDMDMKSAVGRKARASSLCPEVKPKSSEPISKSRLKRNSGSSHEDEEIANLNVHGRQTPTTVTEEDQITAITEYSGSRRLTRHQKTLIERSVTETPSPSSLTPKRGRRMARSMTPELTPTRSSQRLLNKRLEGN